MCSCFEEESWVPLGRVDSRGGTAGIRERQGLAPALSSWFWHFLPVDREKGSSGFSSFLCKRRWTVGTGVLYRID